MKELTIEEKARAYDEALEGIQEILSSGQDPIKMSRLRLRLQGIFPELKESDDEKIRKTLIEMFSNVGTKDWGGIPTEEFIAWFEKQGETDETKAKRYLINKGYPIDTNGILPTYDDMYNIIKDGIEEQSDVKDKGEISDGYHTFNELYYYRMLYNAAFFNMLPKEWVHKSKKHHDGKGCFGGGWFIVMANLPTGQISNHYELKYWELFHIPEKDVADEWDGHTPKEAAERLHKCLLGKQGEKISVVDFKAEDWYVSKVDGKIYNAKFIEKIPTNQDRKLEIEKAAISATGIIEQEEWFIKGAEWADENPSCVQIENQTDKVETKFHEGDWITNGQLTCKVLRATNKSYELHLYSDDYCHFETDAQSVNEYYHLWTIIDAKDGDVLYSIDSNQPFIYKGRKVYEQAEAYCGLNIYGKFFVWDDKDCVITLNNYVPATKEQRDLLFVKMKEYGYEWDAKKKELIKIEPKFKVGNWYQCTKNFVGKGVTFDRNTAYYCAMEGCLQDEYGCHIAIVKDLYNNFKLWDISDAKDGDVLANGTIVLIVDHLGTFENTPIIYSWYFADSKKFYGMGTSEPDRWEAKGFTPATKEQRDSLTKAMVDAGYTFDFGKKELRKIEQKSQRMISAEAKEALYDKVGWSEEDESYLNTAIAYLKDAKEFKKNAENCINWFKSLKQRLGV